MRRNHQSTARQNALPPLPLETNEKAADHTWKQTPESLLRLPGILQTLE